MTDPVKAGALLMAGIPGPELDAETRRLLTRRSIGGVILFRRNLRDVETLAHLTSELHALSSERPILVAIDHEGGRVSRLAEPFTQFPPAAVVGRAASPHLAYRQGAAMGEELRAVGIDIDFAPVLDVHSNPRNSVIGDRSFSSHPRTVSRLGIALAHGLRKSGVIACGKHFPGHGDTELDSHLALPIVRKPFAEVERTELLPFRRAILDGIETLMTAHVVFTALDAERPATLSRRVMTGLLRERLRFRGVVFTDDLEMKAISDHYGVGEAAVLAVEAGADWLLVCEKRERIEEAVDALERAAESRPRLRQRLEESLARVDGLRATHLRRRRRPMSPPYVPPEGFTRHRQLVRWIVERAERAREWPETTQA